jgi:transcriptional regulator of acetoin/glycerol metabolism
LREDVTLLNKMKIQDTLQKCNGNVSKASAMLGISRETLHNRIKKYDIDVQQYRKK